MITFNVIEPLLILFRFHISSLQIQIIPYCYHLVYAVCDSITILITIFLKIGSQIMNLHITRPIEQWLSTEAMRHSMVPWADVKGATNYYNSMIFKTILPSLCAPQTTYLTYKKGWETPYLRIGFIRPKGMFLVAYFAEF